MILSDQDLREYVTHKLGHEPHPDAWRHLENLRRLGDVGDDPEERDALVAELRALEKMLENAQSGPAPTVRETPADQRTRALARLQAADAASLPEVVAFRIEVLRGRLLKPERVEAWLGRREKTEGPPTLYARIPVDDDGRLALPRSEVRQCSAFDFLDYHLAGFPPKIAVREGGPLGRLQRLAESLERRYGWTPHQAVDFILTDAVPSLSWVRVTTGGSAVPGSERVVLNLPLNLPSPLVKRIYREASARLGGKTLSRLTTDGWDPGPRRDVTEKHGELAVFAEQVNDGRTWAAAMDAWNAEVRPEWRYEAARHFARDCRKAVERVTGTPLRWQHKRGRPAG